jgi:hypothetical protein
VSIGGEGGGDDDATAAPSQVRFCTQIQSEDKCLVLQASRCLGLAPVARFPLTGLASLPSICAALCVGKHAQVPIGGWEGDGDEGGGTRLPALTVLDRTATWAVLLTTSLRRPTPEDEEHHRQLYQMQIGR